MIRRSLLSASVAPVVGSVPVPASTAFRLMVFLFMSMATVSVQAQVQVPETLEVELGVGLGYHLCGPRPKLPPLVEAFECPGLIATPQTIKVTLKRENAAKPEWLLWSGTYTETLKFDSFVSKLELSIAYAKLEGKIMGYVDGRLLTESGGKQTIPVYIRVSAEGGFDKFGYSSVYGAPSFLNLEPGRRSEYAPYVAIQAKR